MSKCQRDVDVTDHTIMCLFKGLYALSTTETLSTLARALGVAPAAVLTVLAAEVRNAAYQWACVTMVARSY